MNVSGMFSLTQRLTDGQTLTSSSGNKSYTLRIYIFNYKLYTIFRNFIGISTRLNYHRHLNNSWNEPENVRRNFQTLLDIARILDIAMIVRILARPITGYINKSQYLVGPFLALAVSSRCVLILTMTLNVRSRRTSCNFFADFPVDLEFSYCN